MKTITESLAIKLHARYSLFKEKLEKKREARKGELSDVYQKILKKLIHESHIDPNNFKYYFAETSKYWHDKNADMSERFKLLEKEKEDIRSDDDWNIYMNTLINIPTNTDLIKSSRDVKKVVEDSDINKTSITLSSRDVKDININQFDLALENIKNIGGPEVANEDVLLYFELEVANKIEHEFVISDLKYDNLKETIQLPVAKKNIFWEQLKMALY